MNRTDRLLHMLVILRTRKVVTVDYLKQKLGISTRTVYRDIHLLTELRIKVSYHANKGNFVVNAYREASSQDLVINSESEHMLIIPPPVRNDLALKRTKEDPDS